MVLLTTAVQTTGYYSWDIASNIVRLDRVAACVFGFSRDEAANGVPIGDFVDRMEDGVKQRIAAAIYQCIANDEYYDQEYPILLPDGTRRWVRVLGRCMIGPDALPTHSAGTITDITHLRLGR